MNRVVEWHLRNSGLDLARAKTRLGVRQVKNLRAPSPVWAPYGIPGARMPSFSHVHGKMGFRGNRWHETTHLMGDLGFV